MYISCSVRLTDGGDAWPGGGAGEVVAMAAGGGFRQEVQPRVCCLLEMLRGICRGTVPRSQKQLFAAMLPVFPALLQLQVRRPGNSHGTRNRYSFRWCPMECTSKGLPQKRWVVLVETRATGCSVCECTA